MTGRTAPPSEDDYEVEEKKLAAIEVLNNYSLFTSVCIAEDVRPCDLRLHLMKEISGMRTTLKKKKHQPHGSSASPSSVGKASSSGTTKDDAEEV